MESRKCPGCAGAMERRQFARKPHGTLELDICWTCHQIWFDHHESIALAPSAVLELFEAIDAHREKPVRALAQSARCPRCSAALLTTHDVQRSNRLTYLRCPQGHGRLTSFYQFLREKNFVRSLTVGEVARLRATVQQVRCSSCGGGVELAREMACSYCSAPLSILDADAVKKTLQELGGGTERTRAALDAMAMADSLIDRERKRRTGVDLVDEALHVLLARL